MIFVAPDLSSLPKKTAMQFSILCGLTVTYLYWTYIIFMSHAMNPVSVFVVDPRSGLPLPMGQIGNLMTTVDWSSVRMAVALSVLVFALTTLAIGAAGKALASTGWTVTPAIQ
jgi:hypothetical protein